ncbi:hypothetical protein LuPra_02420 [Luteitalea pratensis]|uniref:Uncharacterized protein n=1 Tax=Luteitalea pratensis TaxID=1855912 RepID=A0A143PKY2_LUTPR|nr:hypothetical protein [Luteitalea pratensis]AMY09207.1 hypothetical protein LuPra_02420 [Luteitalea pratensis]
METLQEFDFVALNFDRDGTLTNPASWTEFKAAAARPGGPTDAIFIAHGFRNDETEARGLYSEFLRTFRRNMAQASVAGALAPRRFLVAGIFWPSKAFRESFGDGGVQSADNDAVQLEFAREQLAELRDLARTPEQERQIAEAMRLLPSLEGNEGAQDEFAALVLSIAEQEGAVLDPSDGFDRIQNTPGSTLLAKLQAPVILPTRRRDPDEGGVLAIDDGSSFGGEGEGQGLRAVFGSIFGRVGQLLNLTSWYVMKTRSGTVGETGVATCVRQLRGERPGLRVHLVGHSLGGRLMAACAKALAQPPVVHVHSLTLLQAAFSHFGLSADNREGTRGFFRDVIEQEVVEGPMVATFSFEDAVVGKAYAIASRLAGDNVQAVGDRHDPFGGIGRNGAQNLTESTEGPLQAVGSAYAFSPRVVHCLDGSGGLITSHGDVENENVTWAFASAVASTP